MFFEKFKVIFKYSGFLAQIMNNISIITFGCSLNTADSEIIEGILIKAGFNIVNSIDDSDLVIINTCTVKNQTIKKFKKTVQKIKQSKKKIIIAGCIAQTEQVEDFSRIGTDQIHKIAEIVEETLKDNSITSITREKNQRIDLPKKRKNKAIEIIPICQGCLGLPCSFCKTKEARGSLFSYDKDAIISKAKKAIIKGVKQIWLTAQDTGAYGKDIGEDLPDLLRSIIKIPGNFRIRLGMLNPNHLKNLIDEITEIYKDKKMFKFIHIPVQSGNNKVLQDMKRQYTIEEFKAMIKKLKQNIPDITIATDIIVGFPGETKQEFQDTLNLLTYAKPDIVNISRYSARPKTLAAEMPNQIHGRDIKKRSRILSEMFRKISLKNNQKWIERIDNIIIDGKGKESTYIGRNDSYKPIAVKGKYKIGDRIKVKIKKAKIFHLIAEHIIN